MTASGTPLYEWVALDLTDTQTLDGVLPRGAVIAGWESRKPTYVARAKHEGHWEVGKLNAWAKIGLSFFGAEIEVDVGEVLVATSCQAPVWINGAFGEHVENVETSQGSHHMQMVARAWHKDRWIPGKVVNFCNKCFFPYGGREFSSRKYQLLSSDFAWASYDKDSSLPRMAVPSDPCMPTDITNCVRVPCPNSTSVPRDSKILTSASLQECQWVVSGDGECHRHAITNEDGYQVARAWACKPGGFEGWVAGFVYNGGFQPSYLSKDSNKRYDYHVLVANPWPSKTSSRLEGQSRLLSLSISLETLEGMLENDLTPPESLFMVTELESGEKPWSALRKMVTEDKSMQGKLPAHLLSMEPLIERLADRENSGEEWVEASQQGVDNGMSSLNPPSPAILLH